MEKRDLRRGPVKVATPTRAGIDDEPVDPRTKRDLDACIEITVWPRGARCGLAESHP
jgi:hypothetical protein